MQPDQQHASEAVCFTAGFAGAGFSAGVIHAYLASGRKPPRLTAGISVGALSAAAMQRSFRDLARATASPDGTKSEQARWKWFRRYAAFLAEKPLSVIWEGIPDVSDLLAPRPPVEDLSATGPLKEKEQEFRFDSYLTIKLARWLSKLPVPVSNLSEFITSFVRWKECYGGTPPYRSFMMVYHRAKLLLPLLWHVAHHPEFVRSGQFGGSGLGQIRFRPLFGWLIWASAVTAILFVGGLVFGGAIATNYIPVPSILLELRQTWLAKILWTVLCVPAGALVLLLLIEVGLLFLTVLNTESGNQSVVERLVARALKQAQLKDKLLHAYPLHRRLVELFQENDQIPQVGSDPMPALLVAAPLQSVKQGKTTRRQLWASMTPDNKQRPDMVEALTTCMALPPLWKPHSLEKAAEKRWWLTKKLQAPKGRLDMVDGSVVRRNPLPSLFTFLKQEWENGNTDFDCLYSHALEGQLKVHLIYDMPIDKKPIPPQKILAKEGDADSLPNSVDAALNGLRLAKRRDSRLEVWQTNYLTRLELSLRQVTGKKASSEVVPIMVNEIGLAVDFRPKQKLDPTESEMLRQVADGCRRMLGVLYREHFEPRREYRCGYFLRHLTAERPWETLNSEYPGLPEVCQHCTGMLSRAPDPPIADSPVKDVLPPSFVAAARNGELAEKFPQCKTSTGAPAGQRKPSIVFVASGGVFRGAFHIGLLGALTATDVRPDFIVGASVGTLMGGVLASICTASNHKRKIIQLHRLTRLFVEVDQEVALTKTLKSAARDLSIRGRSITLSPKKIRKLVARGSEEDPGFAATGAPPALIDAFSDLFLIPYNETKELAADFVAGRITKAVEHFLLKLRDRTVPRLGVQDAVIGTSLLENRIHELLGGDKLTGTHHPKAFVNLRSAQPYEHVAFFATTTDLAQEWMTVLGADLDRQKDDYDFVQAALGSSAFPAAFPARRDSQIYPLRGRRDLFYGDGGMFDNLPFLPAMLILGEAQSAALRKSSAEAKLLDLKERWNAPDLFLVGALDLETIDHDDEAYDSIKAIRKRATELGRNEKTLGFERMMNRIDRTLKYFLGDNPGQVLGDHEALPFLERAVSAAVLTVYPSSTKHLNKTFAFCRSTGLATNTIHCSIADGCFGTLLKLFQAQQAPLEGTQPTADYKSVTRLVQLGLVPKLGLAESHVDGQCKYFTKANAAMCCPFFSTKKGQKDLPALGVYKQCLKDKDHHKRIDGAWKQTPSNAPTAT